MTNPASPVSREVRKRVDDIVRRIDEERWLSSRYASADKRDTLIALYALNFELARIRVQVTEAGLAAIRFQWWRDALEGGYDDKQIDTVDVIRAEIQADTIRLNDLLRLVERHEQAYEAKDRSLEPEAKLARMATYVLAPSHGWGEGIEALAGHWAALRRSEPVGPGPVLDKVPSGIRPAVAHFCLRHTWALEKPNPGPLITRWKILRAIMSGRV